MVRAVGDDVGFGVGRKLVIDVGCANGVSVGAVGTEVGNWLGDGVRISVGEKDGMLLTLGGGVGIPDGDRVDKISTKKPGLKASASSPYTDLH